MKIAAVCTCCGEHHQLGQLNYGFVSAYGTLENFEDCPSAVLSSGKERWGRINLFFFQAEDGIRDVAVTGVQTCALPISPYSETHTAGLQRPRPGSISIARKPSPWLSSVPEKFTGGAATLATPVKSGPVNR